MPNTVDGCSHSGAKSPNRIAEVVGVVRCRGGLHDEPPSAITVLRAFCTALRVDPVVMEGVLLGVDLVHAGRGLGGDVIDPNILDIGFIVDLKTLAALVLGPELGFTSLALLIVRLGVEFTGASILFLGSIGLGL